MNKLNNITIIFILIFILINKVNSLNFGQLQQLEINIQENNDYKQQFIFENDYEEFKNAKQLNLLIGGDIQLHVKVISKNKEKTLYDFKQETEDFQLEHIFAQNIIENNICIKNDDKNEENINKCQIILEFYSKSKKQITEKVLVMLLGIEQRISSEYQVIHPINLQELSDFKIQKFPINNTSKEKQINYKFYSVLDKKLDFHSSYVQTAFDSSKYKIINKKNIYKNPLGEFDPSLIKSMFPTLNSDEQKQLRNQEISQYKKYIQNTIGFSQKNNDKQQLAILLISQFVIQRFNDKDGKDQNLFNNLYINLYTSNVNNQESQMFTVNGKQREIKNPISNKMVNQFFQQEEFLIPEDVKKYNLGNELLYIKNNDCLGDFKNTYLQQNYEDSDDLKLNCFYNIIYKDEDFQILNENQKISDYYIGNYVNLTSGQITSYTNGFISFFFPPQNIINKKLKTVKYQALTNLNLENEVLQFKSNVDNEFLDDIDNSYLFLFKSQSNHLVESIDFIYETNQNLEFYIKECKQNSKSNQEESVDINLCKLPNEKDYDEKLQKNCKDKKCTARYQTPNLLNDNEKPSKFKIKNYVIYIKDTVSNVQQRPVAMHYSVEVQYPEEIPQGFNFSIWFWFMIISIVSLLIIGIYMIFKKNKRSQQNQHLGAEKRMKLLSDELNSGDLELNNTRGHKIRKINQLSQVIEEEENDVDEF